MDLLQALRTNQIERFRTEFTWVTKDKVTKRLAEMDTTHLFNTARLLLNKFSDEQKRTLFVRTPNSYTCSRKNGQTAFFMIWEIEQRDNLERRYRANYNTMLASVFDHQFIYLDLPRAVRPPQAQQASRQPTLMERASSLLGLSRNEPAEPASVPSEPAPAPSPAEQFAQLGTTTGRAAESLNRFAEALRTERPFVGIDYADMESRVMGRFTVGGPEGRDSVVEDSGGRTLPEEMRQLGTMHLSTQMMREHLRPHLRGGQLDATQWLSFVPEPFREQASTIFSRVSTRHLGRVMSNGTLERMIAEFQTEKERAIQEGLLTNQGWRRPNRSTADLEEERLGTRVFTPEHMMEALDRGSRGDQVDLDLWLMTVPDHFREGVEWVVYDRILRRLGNLRLNRRMLNTFLSHFQDFKTSALQAGDLTSQGWVTPAAYSSDADRERRRRERDLRGRGRRMGLDYLRMMYETMGPRSFETQLVPLLMRNPGNRPLLEEFRQTIDRPRGRNPILMVDTESRGLNGRQANYMIFDDPVANPSPKPKKQKEEPKADPTQTIEQLTNFGKRKIMLDDGGENG